MLDAMKRDALLLIWTAAATGAVIFVIFKTLDDRFRETGLDEASIHGTGIMLVDSSFGKI